jgi:hypothetical protein
MIGRGRVGGLPFIVFVVITACSMLLMSPSQCSATAYGQGHPHQGVVPPFQPGDPKVKLDRQALHILNGGNPYSTQIESESGGRGLVVQDIHAPSSVVWERILDYNNYHKMVPKTTESENYKVERHRHGAQTIYTRMKVGFPMIKLVFYVKHEYQPQLNSLTWTLDYAKKSDFDDSCGYWYVIPHPDKSEWTRVFYSVQVSMFDWVPSFVVNFMSSQALTEATAWVKKFSEAEYAKLEPNKKKPPQQVGWLQRLFKHSADEDDKTCASTDDECSTVDMLPETERRVGIQRYALVTAVVVLSLYNVHLFFSQ